MLKFYVIVCSAVSLLTILLFGVDKLASKRDNYTRVPESVLLSLISIGGAFGGLVGMYCFRHKSSFSNKFHFALGLGISLFMQIGVGIYMIIA